MFLFLFRFNNIIFIQILILPQYLDNTTNRDSRRFCHVNILPVFLISEKQSDRDDSQEITAF